MGHYVQYSNPKHEMKHKDRADLLEAYLGALYVDKDLEYCQKFAEVCFFPRLTQFIVNQDWNDPKSKLQQCCLTLRGMDSGEPDIPVYKVRDPTNNRGKQRGLSTFFFIFPGYRVNGSVQHPDVHGGRLLPGQPPFQCHRSQHSGGRDERRRNRT